MFRIIRLLMNTISIPLTVVVYFCIAFMCIFNNSGYNDVIYGIENVESVSEISIKVLAGWILILFLPYIINGIILERSNTVKIFCYVRTRSKALYDRSVHIVCMINSMLWGIIICSVHLSFDRKHFGELFLVLVSHIIMWTSVMLFLYCITNKATISIVLAPLICVASIGISCNNERFSNYSISSIGMLYRGTIYNDNGLSPSIQVIINIVISVILIMSDYVIDEFHGGEV